VTPATGPRRARVEGLRRLVPITRASGRSITITHRRIKNDRLATVGFVWAFMAITNSPPARAHYDRRRAISDRHAAAYGTCSTGSPASFTTA
jgi:hypothetical protein